MVKFDVIELIKVLAAKLPFHKASAAQVMDFVIDVLAFILALFILSIYKDKITRVDIYAIFSILLVFWFASFFLTSKTRRFFY